MIRKYWKHFLAGCTTLVLLSGVATAFGVNFSNPFVMQPEYTTHVVSNAKNWLRYHAIRKADLEYRIYLLKENKKIIPPFMFQKLNYHIEQIRQMRGKIK